MKPLLRALPIIFRTTVAVVVVSALVAGCTYTTPAPRPVDIKAADGVVLKGTLFLAASPGPAILLLHQCDEQRKVWDALGVSLAKSGLTALSVDYRGYGESGGTPHDSLAPAEFARVTRDQWPGDIDSAFAFLQRQSGVQTTRMGAGGGSCGVDHAVHLAMRHDNVKALALLAGGTNRTGRLYIEASGAPPIFAAAAADDKYSNFVEIMSWLFGLSSNKASRMMHYPDGGHAAVVFRAHPDMPDTIAKWFTAVLLDKPALLPVTNGSAMQAEVMNTLREIDQPGGAVTVGKRLADARTRDPNAQLFPEYFVNLLGYARLEAMDTIGAIEIMQLNVAAYPASPNAMDSLGDIYLAAGDRPNALKAARQTLVLLDKDTVDTADRKKDIRTSCEQKINQLTTR